MDDYQIQADLSNCTLTYACKSATENLFPHSHDDYAVKIPPHFRTRRQVPLRLEMLMTAGWVKTEGKLNRRLFLMLCITILDLIEKCGGKEEFVWILAWSA